MLNTTRELYDSFLDGIKKSYTGTVKPDIFNRLINDWGQLEWLSMNVSQAEGIELTQKQLDDLEKLRCVTDGLYDYNGTVLQPIGYTGIGGFFIYPKYTQALNGVDLTTTPFTVAAQQYPKYYRMLNVAFYIQYVNNVCGKTGYGWIGPKLSRTDQRLPFSISPYRKPTDERSYYEFLDGRIRLITNTLSIPIAMRLEYLRLPVEIFYNSTNPADTGNPLTGSVNCEFGYEQKKEIVNTAVRVFWERVKDERYKSFFNEEMLRSTTKK